MVAWGLAFLVCAAVLVLTTHVTRMQTELAEADARRDLANLTSLTQKHTARALQTADRVLQRVRSLYLRDGAKLDLASWFRQGAMDPDLFHQVGIIDARGIYRFSSLASTPAVDLSDREHFRAHLGSARDDLFISKPVLGRVSNKWTIQLTRRIESEGRFVGVVVASVDVAYFSRFYADLDLGAHGSVTLLGLDGVIRARQVGRTTGSDGVGTMVQASTQLSLVGQGVSTGMFEALSPVDQRQRLYYFRRLPDYPLVTLVGYGVNDYRDPIQRNAQMDWLGAALACVLALALAGLFSWHQTRAQKQRQLLGASQRYARLALDSGGLGVWEWDRTGNHFQCDARLRAMLGLPFDAKLTVSQFSERLHPADAASLKRLLPPVLEGRQERLIFEHRLQHPDGHWIWLVARGQVVARDAQGRASRMMGTDVDVTQHRLAQEAARVAAVAFKSSAAMMICSGEQIILSVNPAFETLSGYGASECIGQRASLLKSGRQAPGFYRAMWEQLRGPDGHWEGEVWNRRKDGEVFLDWLSISAVKDEEGAVSHYVAVHADITLRKRTEEEVRKLAFFDPLTGLANRRLLLDRLQQLRATLLRQGQIGAVLYLDLDHFKTLNDRHGHALGDELLQQVAARLLKAVREGDTVSRLGGDEFVVALSQLGTEADQARVSALAVAQKVHDSLGQPYRLGESTWSISASVGVALISDPGRTVDGVIRQADEAMYVAKAGGRNGVRMAIDQSPSDA